MPNHVQNRIEIIGTEEQINQVLEFVKSKESVFDFNSIIPSPIGLFDTVSGNTPEVKKYGWIWQKRYGYRSWYEWCCANWGTKWNAYEESICGNIIEFQTAWSAPRPIVDRLAELFPEVEFEHTWADEDISYNCGKRHYDNGEIADEYLPVGGSNEAFELYFELWGEDESWQLVDGHYEYVKD